MHDWITVGFSKYLHVDYVPVRATLHDVVDMWSNNCQRLAWR